MPSVLDSSSSGDTLGLLSVARGAFKSYGVGLSPRSRAQINGFLAQTRTGFNELFGLAAGPSLTVEGMQTQILGLRARLPESQISASLRGQNVDTAA